MPEEDKPTTQERSDTGRVADLERLVSGLEKHIIQKDEEIERLKKDIELAFSDKLTGIASRRGFERRSELAISQQLDLLRDLAIPDAQERRAEVKSPEIMSFIVVDIDHFKKINDTYGHPTGDAVLRELGKVMNTYLRGRDFAGRWGGDEFVLCITSPHEEVRQQIAERLRRAISEIDVADPEGTKVAITASFGIADWETGDTLEDTVARADAALYVAKNAGRDQVVTEHREDGKSSYLVRQNDSPIPKEKIKDFLKAKAAK